MSVLEQIKEKVDQATNILILTHENPDGDAVGSSLGFMNALKKIGKKVTVLIPEINNMYSFLPGFDEIKHEIDTPEEFDLCIALDSADIERLHICKPYFEKIEHTVVIDHHITNQNFGDVNYVNAIASSTCQNLIVVLAAMDIAISKEMAECIYTGILTDTGGFRYNTQSETFEFAAMLLETGIDIAKIYRLVFDTTTEKRTRLLSRALDRLEILEEGKVAFTYITKQDEEDLQAEDGDHENIVNYGRNIEGVEVSIFAREKGEGKYKLSLRANEYVDVSQIAAKYAGGGHLRAAGLEMNMPIEQVKQTIVDEIKKQLK
ncbi:MAG: bifunctional oligoribonuclease/PAP phosphatase NrnA [Clostridia bacterium]|nr:bifunctional oligoribonuclease/PAP phosphatase NrnA [Clostridia bacterium]